MSAAPEFSVVVPFFNEVTAAPAFLAELQAAMHALGRSHEALLVDDGSTDGTAPALERATAAWPEARVIRVTENCGQAAALWRGFTAARGAWIVTLDGDGQNVPADILRLVALTSDHDMIVGIRAKRRDSAARRAMARIANAVRSRLLGDGLADIGCALKVFRREVVAEMVPLRSLYSFIPAFAVAAGFRVTEIAVQHRPRTSGKSKYGFAVFAWKPLADTLALWWYFRRSIILRQLPKP